MSDLFPPLPRALSVSKVSYRLSSLVTEYKQFYYIEIQSKNKKIESSEI